NDINPITGNNTLLTVTGIVTSSPLGTLIITNSLTGAYTFIPNANVELAQGVSTTTSAIYSVCNINGCTTAQIAITITGINDAPIATNVNETTNEDLPLNGTITGFSDVDNLISQLTLSTVSGSLPNNGTLIFNPNGTYIYTPNLNFNGTDSFTYQVCDLNTCTNATVNITINSQNDRPIALNTTFSGFEETTISGVLVNNSLTGNYYDLDGDLLSINSISGFATSNGIVSISNNGTFIYIPNSNFSGIDIYTYQVCDASNLCAQAQIIFSITGINDAPIFPATTISGSEDVPLIGNISGVLDPENDSMTITGISTSPNGILTVLTKGDYTFTGTNNFNGIIPFTITICDPFTCTSSVVTILVSPMNDAPNATNILINATENGLPVAGTITGISTSNSNNNVFDIDNTTLTITAIPTAATTNGTIQLNSDGTYSFTVNSGLILPVGQILTESIPYQVCDLVTCTSANLLITIVGVNDAPVAQNRISATDPSQLVTIQGIATDPDNDVLTYSIINVIVNSSVTGTPIYSINSTTGLISYTPSSDISIHVDYVIYAACDPSGACSTAQIAINVPATPLPPNSISTSSTINEDALSTIINVNSLVSDPNGDIISITGIVPIPTNQGTISLINGVLTFVPAFNFNGTITLTFTGCEVANLTSCTSNIITINVLPINDAPIIANKTNIGNEDSTVTGSFLNLPTDNDPDGTSLDINSTPVSGPSFGTITINTDGTYIYVPNSNFNGIEVITVQICDIGTPLPQICTNITLTITVNGVNDAPIAPLVTIVGNEDMVIIHTLTGISDPDNGDILTITTINGAVTTNGGTVTISGNGLISYLPAPNFTGNDTYSYEVCDNGNPKLCVQRNISILVTPINDAPIARDDIYSFNPNQTISGFIKMITNDSDPDGNSFVYSLIKHTSSIPADKGIITSFYSITGEIDYFTGLNSTPRTDSVFYQICDNGVPSKCDSAVLIIIIPATPLAPQVLNESATTPEDVAINVQIVSNDYDPNRETITHIITTQPKNGIAVLNTLTGIVTYTPNQNYFGKDTLTYSVCDPTITCSSGFVFYTITPVNDAPTANPVVVNTTYNTPISNTILGYSDVDNATLTITPFVGTIIGGNLIVNANGTFTFTPNASFTGSTVFNYQVCDPTITCTSSTLTINVSSSTSPILLSDDIQTIEDVSISGNVFTNDLNPLTGNNTGLTITGFINNGNNIGILSINSLTGIYNFVPNVELPQGITTTTSYFYTACYANECSTAQIAITVTGVNDAPIGTNVNTLTTSNTSITGTVPFSDPDGNVTITSQNLTNTSGTFTVSTTGGYTFIPNGTFTGIVSFTIVGCDLFTCTSAVITIDVQNPISTLQVRDDLISTNENTSITGNILSNDLNPITGDNSQITLSGITNILDNIGIFTINSVTGFYSFVPTIELAQGIVTITSAKYTACNANGCEIGQISITVIGVNDAPLVTVNSPINGGNLTGTIPGFITLDPDGDVLTITAVGGIENVGTLTILPNGTYTFIPNPNSTVSGLVPFNITVCDIYTCTSAVIFINIPAKATTEEEVKIPNGFSPNGDGINDDFVIVKPNNSPKVTLKVFNRWGNFVYEKDDYDNTWNGSSNKGIVVGNGGNGLPDGTYYIIVDFNNGSEKTIKYITISR
ncbi:MAG: tandem-95 repeat protein, partial [Cytophagales bacterium]